MTYAEDDSGMQLDLFGTRTSCRKFLANWLRILFSALAYILMQRLREILERIRT